MNEDIRINIKDIEGYEGFYAITENGKVWSYKNDKFLKPISGGGGYFCVDLCKNGELKRYLLHRLVAETFIPNPNNYPCVNHKDEDRLNNNVNNLEWCTYKYNNNYGNRNKKASKTLKGKHPSEKSRKKMSESRSKPVKCVELNIIFSSIIIAGKELGINRNSIGRCCQGKYKTAGKFHWEYVDKGESR